VPQTVTLALYNTAGQLVQSIQDAVGMDAGSHVDPVRLTDLPAGLYVLRLQTAAQTLTRLLAVQE